MDFSNEQMVWAGLTVAAIIFVWWFIARNARIARERAWANEIDDRIAEEARETSREARRGPNVRTALNRSRNKYHDDFDDDDGFDGEDLLDAIETVAHVADAIRDEREHPEHLMPAMEPVREPTPAPEPVHESPSYDSGSSGSSYDSGSSDSGGGGGAD